MSLGQSTEFEGAVKPNATDIDAFEPDLHAHRYCEIPSTLQWRFDYGSRTDGQAVYQGFGAMDLPEGSDGWLVYMFEYDGNNMLTKRTAKFGSWTNHASLFGA